MDRVAYWSRQLLDESGPGAIGLYTTGQLFLEEYYTLAVIAHARHRHQPPRRQHPPVHHEHAELIAHAAEPRDVRLPGPTIKTLSPQLLASL